MNLAVVRGLTRRALLKHSSLLLPSLPISCSLHSSLPFSRLNQPEKSGPSGWLEGVKSYFRWPNRRFQRLDLIKSGENLYILCAEFPEFSEFVRVLRMPDSYQTWLSITILHTWLCMVRIKREADDGKYVRDIFFKTLFDDVERRAKSFSLTDKERDLDIVNKQLYGSLFAYDEALLSGDDRVLAAALWRDFFHQRQDLQPQELELMVAYTRKQLAYLDEQTPEDIFAVGVVKFLPLEGDKEEESFVNRRVAYALSAPSVDEMARGKKKPPKRKNTSG